MDPPLSSSIVMGLKVGAEADMEIREERLSRMVRIVLGAQVRKLKPLH